MFNSLKQLFGAKSQASYDTPRAEWPERTKHIVKGCKDVRPFLTEAWFPVIVGHPMFGVTRDTKTLSLSPISLQALTAYQTVCAVSLIGTLRYIAPPDGHDYGDYLAAAMYGGGTFQTCPFMSGFLDAEAGAELFQTFADAFSAALIPDNETDMMLAIPPLVFAAQDMQFLVSRIVAEAFDDNFNAKAISAQREQFFKGVRSMR
jgi:hypothetical protein